MGREEKIEKNDGKTQEEREKHREAVFKERKKGAFVPSNDRVECDPPHTPPPHHNPPALQVYEYLLLLLLTTVP